MSSLFLSFLLLFGTSLASCKYKFIHNTSELIDFSNGVNSGTSYVDYTVYLVADINFNETLSQQFNPISGFLGTFDGQGYVIKNLTISTSTFTGVGLFGSTNGMTVKNVVVDSSCSVTVSSSSSVLFIGSILGYCVPSFQPCVLDNNMNMGSVTFSGIASGDLHIGGVIGVVNQISNVDYGATVKNCVNYGTVTHKGTVYGYHDIGGIAGHITHKNKYVYNCVNYGTLYCSGYTLEYKFMGGIIGWG